jgi:hypothetical protein
VDTESDGAEGYSASNDTRQTALIIQSSQYKSLIECNCCIFGPSNIENLVLVSLKSLENFIAPQLLSCASMIKVSWPLRDFCSHLLKQGIAIKRSRIVPQFFARSMPLKPFTSSIEPQQLVVLKENATLHDFGSAALQVSD